MRTVPGKPIILSLLLLISFGSYAQMKWRVCSKINETATTSSGKTIYTPKDSTAYHFSQLHSRGSDSLNTVINYDSATVCIPGAPAPKIWGSSYFTYNSADKKLTQCFVYKDNFTDTLGVDTFVYNSGGLLMSHTTAGTHTKAGVKYWVTKTVAKYQYNAKQQLIFIDSFNYQNQIGRPIANVAKRYLEYDAAGRIICDSTRRPYAGGWINYEYTYFLYNAAGINYLTREFYGTNCCDQSFCYHIYQSDNKKITDSTILLANLGQPNNYAAITKYGYDNKGRLKSKYYYNSSTKQISFGYLYTYTSFGYLAAIEEQQMSSANIVEPTERTRYNYQAHWPTAITNAASETNNLMLFPVPAQDYLTINWLVNEQTVIHGMITDMQGRQVASWTDEASGVYNKTITTQNLPSGQYNLQLYTTGGIVQKSFTVIK